MFIKDSMKICLGNGDIFQTFLYLCAQETNMK